jgi:hypothetical protein
VLGIVWAGAALTSNLVPMVGTATNRISVQAVTTRAVLLLGALTGLLPRPSVAQTDARTANWRLGAALVAPATVLDLPRGPTSDLVATGGSSGDVRTGFGAGLEGARRWSVGPKNGAAIVARIVASTVNVRQGGGSWRAGRSIVLDAVIRDEFPVSSATWLFGGFAVSHWSGPSRTAPYHNIGKLLFGGEAGGFYRVGSSPWSLTALLHLTRIGDDEASDVHSGFVWRWMIGIQREY